MDTNLSDELSLRAKPTPSKPLLGVTILVVEDSRFASEAVRLMSLRSGARLRRADCLTSARRHLSVYCPSVVVVDLGLPDGSGLDFISEIARGAPTSPLIIGTSGADPVKAEQQALAAGANDFFPKPIPSIAAFQGKILAGLPVELRLNGPRPAATESVEPDLLALKEDLHHAISVLEGHDPPIAYVQTFLLGLARTTNDLPLEERAKALVPHASASDIAQLQSALIRRVDATRARL